MENRRKLNEAEKFIYGLSELRVLVLDHETVKYFRTTTTTRRTFFINLRETHISDQNKQSDKGRRVCEQAVMHQKTTVGC